MTKERRLGRGLEALLGQLADRSGPAVPAQYQPSTGEGYGQTTEEPYAEGESAVPASAAESAAAGGYDTAGASPPPPTAVPPGPASDRAGTTGSTGIDIRQIDSSPAQPRQDFQPDDISALVESIHAHGLLQPVVVRRRGDRYELVAGERRLRAAIQAGWTQVPANVVQADDRQAAELAIVENLHRKDLNPLEKAASFQRYLEQYGGTQEELAARLKLDRSTIANFIRLLELPEEVQDALRQGKITQGHARALLPLGEEREQVAFCQRIQREGLNVRQTETLVQEAIAAADVEPLALVDREGHKTRPARGRSEQLVALEQEFRAALGMKVRLTHNARGRGRLVIQFRSHEEFERLREHICGPAQAQSHAG